MQLIIITLLLTFAIAAEEIPLQKIRLCPVGDPPPFRQVVHNGVRMELDPPRGTCPPSKVKVSGMMNQEKAPIEYLRLSMGCQTPDFYLPQSSNPINIEDVEGASWTKIHPHLSGNSLVLLWKSGTSWSDVGHLVIDAGQATHIDHAFFFTNVSALDVGLVVGNEKIILQPKKTVSRIFKQSTPCRIVFQQGDKKLKTCFESELSGSVGIHQRLIIYPTNSATSRNPLKVLTLGESHSSSGIISSNNNR